MFGSMKKAMVAAVIVAVGAMAPAMASAEQWTTNGSTPYAGTGKANGVFTLLSAGGLRTTCTVEASLDLSNPGGVAAGNVTAFVFGALAGGTCTTTASNCTVNISAFGASLPWAVTTSGTNVTITNLGFLYKYLGSGCPLNGVPFNASGSITGSVVGDVLSFVNAGPLTTTLGSAGVDADLSVTDSSGNPVSMF